MSLLAECPCVLQVAFRKPSAGDSSRRGWLQSVLFRLCLVVASPGMENLSAVSVLEAALCLPPTRGDLGVPGRCGPLGPALVFSNMAVSTFASLGMHLRIWMSSQTSAPRSSVSCNLACLLPDKKSLVDFFFFLNVSRAL